MCVCVCALVTAGVGVYPQTEHIQPMLPGWIYNDSLVPGKHLYMNMPRIMFQIFIFDITVCLRSKNLQFNHGLSRFFGHRFIFFFLFFFSRNVQEGS